MRNSQDDSKSNREVNEPIACDGVPVIRTAFPRLWSLTSWIHNPSIAIPELLITINVQRTFFWKYVKPDIELSSKNFSGEKKISCWEVGSDVWIIKHKGRYKLRVAFHNFCGKQRCHSTSNPSSRSRPRFTRSASLPRSAPSH